MKYNYEQQTMYNEQLDIFNDNCCWRCEHITSRKNGVGKCKHQVEAIDRVGKCDKYKGETVIESLDRELLKSMREKALSNDNNNIFTLPKI